jgi:hypothetical protein
MALHNVTTPLLTTGYNYSNYNEYSATTFTAGLTTSDLSVLITNPSTSTGGLYAGKTNIVTTNTNLSNFTGGNPLRCNISVTSIQSNTGTLNGVRVIDGIFQNVTAGGTVDKAYVYHAGFDGSISHAGTTNTLVGYYMSPQGSITGVPSVSNRYGVYIEDDGRNYFAGDVGIGISAPLYNLHVYDDDVKQTLEAKSGSPLLQIKSSNGASTTKGAVYWSDTSSNAVSGIASFADGLATNSGDLRFYVSTEFAEPSVYNLSRAMTIDTSGNVAIGITSASAKLHVNNTGSGNSFLVEDSANPDTTPFLIDNNGNVAIGTSTISTKLNVVQTAITGSEEISRFTVSDNTSSYLSIENGTSTSSQFIPQILGVNSSTRFGLILIGQGTTDTGTESLMTFNARIGAAGAVTTRPLYTWGNYTTEVMRINASGNVGINNNNPQTRLGVGGEIRGQIFSNVGVTNNVTDANFTLDASTNQFATWIVSFGASRTLQVSNLTDGRWVKVYVRNTNSATRAITWQASTTTSGFANVNMSNGGGAVSVTSTTLAATTGTAVVWIANIGGTIVGSVS